MEYEFQDLLRPHKERPLLSRLKINPVHKLSNTPNREKENLKANDCSPQRLALKSKPLQSPKSKGPSRRNCNIQKVQMVTSYGSEKAGCKNHNERNAQFVIQIDLEQFYYCQKCALLLASQGFKVLKLSQESKSPKESVLSKSSSSKQITREGEVQGVLKILQRLIPDLQSCRQKILIEEQNVERRINQQLQISNNYYSKLVSFVEAMKKRTADSLRSARKRALQLLAIYQSQLSEQVQQLRFKQRDIKENLQSIIGDVDQDTYRPIIKSYKTHCQMMADKLQEIANSNIDFVSIANLPDQYLLEKFAVDFQQHFQLRLHQTNASGVAFSFDSGQKSVQKSMSRQTSQRRLVFKETDYESQESRKEYPSPSPQFKGI